MIGTLLNGRYRLDAESGRGGMAVVYRAHDLLLERDVAVKVLDDPKRLGTEGRARLLHEAQAAARLNHPHIVSVYDASEADGRPFIVMEFVQGASLAERMPKSLDAALAVARQICAALEHAHAQGIVHRDLKPENALVTPDGTVKLVDFGLARSMAARLTVEGGISGTVFYLAPEVALGQPVDGRADLYSFGVMLYEMVVGRLPFLADEPLAVISQHLYASPVPPHALLPDLPPALDDLIMSLLAKQPGDRPASAQAVGERLAAIAAGAPGAAEGIGEAASPLERLARGRLIGREHELAEMIAAWRRAAAGAGGTLLVSGEPGIGKTRLVRELRARAAVAGGRVLAGECYADGGMPYAPVAPLLAESAGDLDLPAAVMADLATLAPALAQRYPAAVAWPGQAIEQQRLFESAGTWAAALAARAPVLLFVDDVHWADSGTVFLLRHLARRARKLRLLLVMTYRESDLREDNGLQGMLHDLHRERAALRIKLGRLTREETGEMLAAMLTQGGGIDPALAEAIHRETEGNPFFIEEVCKALIEQGQVACTADDCRVTARVEDLEIPQSVRLTIQARLARLPVQAQDVLRMAAVLGREFDFDVLLRATGLDEDALIEALEAAERAQIIAEAPRARGAGPGFVFAHALIPTTLREALSGPRRQRMQRQAAQAIEAVHPQDYEALARHYAQAGDDECARAYYAQAGHRAFGLYANAEAERHFRAALELGGTDAERAPLLAALGEVLFRESRYAEAIATWQTAISAYAACGDHDRVAYLYARSARAAWYTGDPPRGLALARAGMAAMPAGFESPGMAALLHETARAHHFNGLSSEALVLGRQAFALAKRLDLIEVQAEALSTLGILRHQPHEAAHQALAQAVELAEAHDLWVTAARAHVNLGEYLHNAGDLTAALEHYLRARELARRVGLTSWEISAISAAFGVCITAGDRAAAEELLATARELPAALPPDSGLELLPVRLEAQLHLLRGNPELAVPLLERCREGARRRNDFQALTDTDCELAECRLALGRLDAVEPILAEAIDLSDRGLSFDMVGPRCRLAWLRAQQGRNTEAQELLDEARFRRAPGTAPERDEGLLAWTAARLCAAAERWSDADAAYADFTARALRAGARGYAARALAEWAAACRASGDMARAEELERRADELTRE